MEKFTLCSKNASPKKLRGGVFYSDGYRFPAVSQY